MDPMVGGGTTPDVCLVMGRKCLSYDVAPIKERPEINNHDIRKGLPEKPKSKYAKLIFMDPPYFRKKDYGEDSISNLSKEKYLAVFRKVAEDAKQWLTKDGKIAFLMSDFNPFSEVSKDVEDTIWVWDYIHEFEKVGFEVIRRISCPLPQPQLHPNDQKNFPKEKKMGRLTRDLIIFGRKK